MIDYKIRYVDDHGDYQEYDITSTDVRTAMNNAFELCPDIRRIVRCAPKEMFND